MKQSFVNLDAAAYDSLSDHIRSLHDRILEFAPKVVRIGCALYDPQDDLLKTFINSTREGEPLRSYEYHLAKSPSLAALAKSREVRVLNDLKAEIDTGTEHSNWVLGMGYRSSLTVPMHYQDTFIGFLFFDSKELNAFTPQIQHELVLYARMITLAIANELVAIRSILGTVHVARDFAELRDLETGGHLERVSHYAREIARNLVDSHGLSDEFVEHVFLYAPLHDIGKIGIPDRILLKPGKLDAAEWEVMKTHTTLGAAMIETIKQELGVSNYSAYAVMTHIVESHHEFMDGSGYPHGLAGNAIPLEARVVTVADIFDALSTKRPYKEPWTMDQCFAELDAMVAAGKLDGAVVAALGRNRLEIEAIGARFTDQLPDA